MQKMNSKKTKQKKRLKNFKEKEEKKLKWKEDFRILLKIIVCKLYNKNRF